jgi:hypothetical protein
LKTLFKTGISPTGHINVMQHISLWRKLKADILKSVVMTAIEGYEKRHHYFTSIVVAVSKFDSGVISSRR